MNDVTKRPDAKKLKELEEKINQIAKHEDVSEYYVQHMRDALSSLKYGDVNSAMKLLIAILLEPKKYKD